MRHNVHLGYDRVVLDSTGIAKAVNLIWAVAVVASQDPAQLNLLLGSQVQRHWSREGIALFRPTSRTIVNVSK